MIGQTTTAFALSMAVAVAVIYFIILRFMDLNEKEPFWAMAAALGVGAGLAALTRGLVDTRVLELENFGGSLTREVAKFLALIAVLALLTSSRRVRGWSEFHGLMDGVVYGTAVGLGFAVGEAFLRELAVAGTPSASLAVSRFDILWATALSGLAEGLFGAVVGAGFGLASLTRLYAARLVWIVGGLIGAVLLHWGYLEFVRGGDIASQSLLRSWIALTLPLLFVLTVTVVALRRERRAIEEELADESTGVVTKEDLRALRSFFGRRLMHAKRFLGGDFDGWYALRTLHNRQVQLALSKQQGRRLGSRGEDEAESVRRAVLQARREYEEASAS
jgi:RsiW-degrading membrane proteinase PrsW (M82 family)